MSVLFFYTLVSTSNFICIPFIYCVFQMPHYSIGEANRLASAIQIQKQDIMHQFKACDSTHSPLLPNHHKKKSVLTILFNMIMLITIVLLICIIIYIYTHTHAYTYMLIQKYFSSDSIITNHCEKIVLNKIYLQSDTSCLLCLTLG